MLEQTWDGLVCNKQHHTDIDICFEVFENNVISASASHDMSIPPLDLGLYALPILRCVLQLPGDPMRPGVITLRGSDSVKHGFHGLTATFYVHSQRENVDEQLEAAKRTETLGCSKATSEVQCE